MSNFTTEAQAFSILTSVADTTPPFKVSAAQIHLAITSGTILVSATSATSATGGGANAYIVVSSNVGPLYIQCRTSAF